TVSGTIFFAGSSTTGNSNNNIRNNQIADATTGTPANAIYAAGTAGQENVNNTISGNLIYNYFQPAVISAGILLAANNSGWTIDNNKLYQTTARVFTVGLIHRGIQITGGDGYTVSGNVIGAADETGAGLYQLSGTGVRFTGIELTAGILSPSSLQGNRIANLQLSSSSGGGAPQGIFSGIYIAGGNVNVGTVTGNVIGAGTGNGSITIIPSAASSVVTGITYNSTGIADIRNNIVGAIDLVPTGVLSGNVFAVQVLGAGATVSIQNNTLGGNSANSIGVGVKGTTTGNGIIRGIFTNNNGTMNISNNLIQNLTHNSNNVLALFRAIECQVGTVTITGNTINNIAAEGVSVNTATHEGIGILVSTAVPNIVIDSNTISNLSLTNTGAIGTILSGIYIGSLNTGARITRNKLFGFSNAATGVSITAPPVASGIYLRDVAAGGGELFVANNMIALGSTQTTNTSFIGIWNQVNPALGYNERIYYNTINIDGAAGTGAQPSFAFYRGNFTATFTGPTVDIKNNIFSNNRTGGTGFHYAIANSYGAAASGSGWSSNASNYNVLNASAATVGYWSTNQSFADWKESSLSDNNSLSAVAVTFVNPASNLHLVANVNGAVDGKATPLAAVTTDFDTETRDVLTPDMGADEIFTVVPVRIEFFRGQKQVGKNLLEWKVNSSSTSVQFIIERSRDGISFATAGNVTASLFTRIFSFYDVAPAAGLNYYRLKIVEDDGTVSYSAIISFVSDVKNLDVSIRPNVISNGTANLFIQSEKATQLSLKVVDASGKIIGKKTMNIASGTGIYPINISALAKGVYYISISDIGIINTQQIVVE
ncbi:MAG: T9SS type A sorting domain-containing protein, partial [Chitinophagaceae bacterium]